MKILSNFESEIYSKQNIASRLRFQGDKLI